MAVYAPLAAALGISNNGGGSTPSSGTSRRRTSAVEDYYNEQMQKKQATEKARDIIDGRGRGHVGGLRDAWLDKNREAESKTVDSRGHNSALRNEYQRQHPNVPTASIVPLSDDGRAQLQNAYVEAYDNYTAASKKAKTLNPPTARDVTSLERYRSEQQAAIEAKAAAEFEVDRLRKQLESNNIEIPKTEMSFTDWLKQGWYSINAGITGADQAIAKTGKFVEDNLPSPNIIGKGVNYIRNDLNDESPVKKAFNWMFGDLIDDVSALSTETKRLFVPEYDPSKGSFLDQYIGRGNEVADANRTAASEIAGANRTAQRVNQDVEIVAYSLPMTLLAMLSGGAAGAAAATPEALQATSALANSGRVMQTLKPIIGNVGNAIKDPNWQFTFASVFGESYERALAEGASNEDAVISAVINAAENATIEIGGGAQGLGGLQNKNLWNGAAGTKRKLVADTANSVWQEIMEEVTQGMAEAASKGVYQDVPLYSTADNNAVINPNRAKEEARGAAIASAVFGGGRAAVSGVQGIRANTEANRSAARVYGSSVDALIEQGLESEAGTESHRLAEQYQEIRSKGGDLTGGQIRKLIAANEEAFQAENASEELAAAETPASEPHSTTEAQGDITAPPTASNDAVARPAELNSTINNNVETQNADAQKNTVPNGTESTAVNDNPATHTAEENKIIADYKAAADKNVISGIERARSLQDINYRNKFTVTLAETVGDRVVNLVKNATGLDVTGFKNQIKGNSIAHIDKRHGVNGTADHSMANIEDFGRINYVVENADRARLLSAGDVDSETWKLSREYRNADNSQAPLIRFEKRVDNTYYVVEAVPDSKANRMAVVSAYMETAKKEASSPKSVDAAEAAPRATPEASLEISETSDNSIPTAEENVNRGQAENSANADTANSAKASDTDFHAGESDNTYGAEKDQAYYVDLARKLKERGWSREDIKDATGFVVDDHGNVYDEDTGEVHYDAQEEAEKDAWKRAAEDFGEKNRDTIHEATSKAADFETFLENEEFLKGFDDSRYTEISDAVTEFKSKLAGVGDGRVPFSEFADYYKAMKNSDILGDLYSERVNEQVQLAKALSDAAQKNPTPYDVEKYRSAVTKAMQMASHYVEKANKVRTELDELTAAVKENGSKMRPRETRRNPSLKSEAESTGEKLGAKFIRYQSMPRQMFQMIDGFKYWEKGAGYRMADTIEKSAAKNQTVLVEADNFFSDVVKEKAYRDFSTGKTMSGVMAGNEELSMDMAVSLYKAIKTMGGPEAYRTQHLAGFALYNGNEKPTPFKPDDISRLYFDVKSAIESDPIAKAYVEAFDDMADYIGKETARVSKEVDGADIYTYVKGDYFPLTYSSAEGNYNWDKQKAQEFGLPDFKSLKDRTRTEGGYVNISPIAMVTDGYIRRAADYIAFGELADTFSIMDYMHTFGTSTLVDSVKQNMGSEYGAWMENYVKDVQDINQTRAKSNYNGWSKLTRNFQTAVLVGNPGTQFKQKGSMWLAMSELDPRAVAKAAVTSLNPGNQQMKAARDNPLLQFRAKGNIDASISDALQDQSTLFGKMAANSKVLKKVQNWIPKADVREVSKVYLASCYDVQMKNPGIDVNSAKFKEMADETFQRASMRTQSQYTMNTRDEISRGDSALLKALTMFQTQQRTTANNMFTAINEARAAKGTEHAAKANKALKNAATGFFASNVAYATMDVLAKGLRHKLKQFRDDDAEQQIDAGKIGIELLKSFFEGVGGTVIFGDDVTNFVESIISGETFYENGIGAIGAIEDAASAIAKLFSDCSADNARRAAGGIATLAGIPLNNAYTLLNSIGMWTLDIINGISRSRQSSNDFWGFLAGVGQGTSAADIAGKKKAGLYSISDDPADDSLKIFDSIRKAVDKLAPDQFTYTDENGDEVSYELTKADKEQYRKDAEASYNTGMDALLASAGYGKLDAKDKKALDKALRDYAKNAAEQGYLDSKELDHDTGASAWMRNLSEDEVPKYLVAKQALKGMYKDGKISDFAALDSYLKDRKDGYLTLTVAQRDALSDSFPRINDIHNAVARGISSEKWAVVYDKYMELDKTREDGYNATDKATDLAAFIDKQGFTDAQAKSLKEQFKFYSHIAAEPTRYERLIDAGYSPDKANELYYRLDNMSTDGNSNVSQAEAYARLSTMDDLTNAEKDAIWAIINSGWKTTYTKYDRYHRNDVVTQTSSSASSKNSSSSASSAEAYFRQLGLLK